MATNRKLGRTTDQRLALLRSQATSLILNGQIKTTVAKAKEVTSIVEHLISLAIKEKDNFETVKVKVSRAKLDSKGKRVTEKVTSKNGKEYYRVVRELVEEERQKDMPSRLAARRKIMNKLYKVKDEKGNNIDLPKKLFTEIASKYENRKGGYTRIIKIGARKGDNAQMALVQLV